MRMGLVRTSEQFREFRRSTVVKNIMHQSSNMFKIEHIQRQDTGADRGMA